MNNLIIFDFEVFKYDTLFGAKIINNNNVQLYQTWNLEEIKEFYNNHKDNSIWIGHNNSGYDNWILSSIVRNKNPYEKSKDIIENGRRFKFENLPIKLYYYDLMSVKQTSLKTLEAFEGKNISESEVDFDIDRPLTKFEKELTESYNRDDLEQTEDDFNYLKDSFMLKLKLLNEFNLPLDYLPYTEAMIAGKVLKAKKIPGIEYQNVEPKVFPFLKLKNQKLMDFFLGKTWLNNASINVNVCGTDNKVARGGIHGALEKCHFDKALYIDVSGYYNLIMINLGLLPRTMNEEGKQVYTTLYHQQLAMKKTNPVMRKVFKVILLAVSGAMMNEHTDFYDPFHGDLMRLNGQLFLVDLLEKLEGKVTLVQSNTDGIIIVPINGYSREDVVNIAKEWMERTGFNAKVEDIYNITQRDVNNYMYQDDKGEIHTLGEAVKHYNGVDNPFETDGFNSKESLIISKAIVDYYINNILPEETVEKNKSNLKYFQYICKKISYDYCEFEEILQNGDIVSTRIQNVNRAFASNDKEVKGMVYKYKKDGKKAKIPNLPDNVFVYNNDIRDPSVLKELENKIDYQYYIDRIYERIAEFIKIKTIKDINL